MEKRELPKGTELFDSVFEEIGEVGPACKIKDDVFDAVGGVDVIQTAIVGIKLGYPNHIHVATAILLIMGQRLANLGYTTAADILEASPKD